MPSNLISFFFFVFLFFEPVEAGGWGRALLHSEYGMASGTTEHIYQYHPGLNALSQLLEQLMGSLK